MSNVPESLNFAKRCEFSLEVDNINSTIPITDTVFTIQDSIYQLYPKATFSIKDTSGMYNEFLTLTNGTKIKLSWGKTKEDWKHCTYTVIDQSMPEQNNPNSWGGNIELSLIHEYFYNQTKESKAFDNNISDIVSELANKYPFKKINIDNTLNSGKWYQTYLTDADFIINRLMPFAYSTDCKNTPFYCFIDSNNNFNLKNYKNMSQQNPIFEYRYKSKGIPQAAEDNTIINISFAQCKVADLKPNYKRLTGHFDKEGKWQKLSENKITNYPSDEKNPIPIKANTDVCTDVFHCYDFDVEDDETKNNNLGQEINNMKFNMNIDKFIITVPFNREITAGCVISLKLPSTQNGTKSSEMSLRFSGNYVVESTFHKWDGRQAITMLVCGKQSVKLTGNYRNLSLICNR